MTINVNLTPEMENDIIRLIDPNGEIDVSTADIQNFVQEIVEAHIEKYRRID